jgi:tripartite-type tricarboxylate transporter receptor subunit TctC
LPEETRRATIFRLFPAFGTIELNIDGLSPEPYFKDKTIRIIVGFSAGGGYDVYARAIARHMGKHIAGNPSVVVDNMAGAASLISANHVYKVAKPDGLTIGHFIGGLFLQQVLGRQGVEFDARKFEHLGVPVKDTYSIGLTKASGVTNFDQWLAAKTPLKIGGTAPGSSTDDVPNVLHAALGLPLQVVSGYKGTADIRIAAESGEVAGFCTGWSLSNPPGASRSIPATPLSPFRRCQSHTRSRPKFL